MTANSEYGKALFSLTEEEGTTDTVLCDIKAVSEVFSQNPDYIKLLDSPAIQKDERLALIDGAFSEFNTNLVNLIKILCEKHITHTFSSVKNTYAALYNESRGIEEVEAVSAVLMTEEQLLRMKEKLESMTGKTVIIKNTIDSSILGGVKLRYCGIQLDGSVKTRLDKFNESLKNTVI